MDTVCKIFMQSMPVNLHMKIGKILPCIRVRKLNWYSELHKASSPISLYDYVTI